MDERANFKPLRGTERLDLVIRETGLASADLLDRAIGVAQKLAALPATTFAMTKRQMHLPVIERMQREGDKIDAAVIEIWAAPEATARIQDYVARTLKKR